MVLSNLVPQGYVQKLGLSISTPIHGGVISSQRRFVGQLQQKVMKDRDNFALWDQNKKARNEFCSSIRKAKKAGLKIPYWGCVRLGQHDEGVKGCPSTEGISGSTPQKEGWLLHSNNLWVLNTLLDEFFPDSSK